MKIAVTANGNDLDAPVSPVFGRCPAYILVDTETMQYEAVTNPAVSVPTRSVSSGPVGSRSIYSRRVRYSKR